MSTDFIFEMRLKDIILSIIIGFISIFVSINANDALTLNFLHISGCVATVAFTILDFSHFFSKNGMRYVQSICADKLNENFVKITDDAEKAENDDQLKLDTFLMVCLLAKINQTRQWVLLSSIINLLLIFLSSNGIFAFYILFAYIIKSSDFRKQTMSLDLLSR